MRRKIRQIACAATMTAAITASAGCGMTVEKLPLPKPGVDGDSYQLHAVFENALNLPSRAHVKVGGSDVGVVTKITTSNFAANIDMDIRKDIQLPKGTTAELRQATPLGDVFVAMSMPPKKPGDQMLQDGETIGLEQTSAGATVEELMISASALLNGGGINQLVRMVGELDSVFAGRGPQLAHLLSEMTGVITSLNQRTEQIDGVLRQSDAMLSTLNARKAELGQTADTLPTMIGVVAENNQAIGNLVNKLSVATTALGDFANTSGGDLQSLLDNTDKLMTGIAQSGDRLGSALDSLHNVVPNVNATFEGNSLAFGGVVSYLSIGALTDPKQKLPDGSDITAFVGSLAEVLQRVYARVTGGQR